MAFATLSGPTLEAILLSLSWQFAYVRFVLSRAPLPVSSGALL